MGRLALTIELARKGEHLHRRYHFPPEGSFFFSKERFDDIGASYQVGAVRGLPALGNGRLSDIRKFLGQEEQGCDPGIVDRLARAIYERTSGKYVETLELLRKGFEFGWPLLLQELGGSRSRPKAW